MFIESVRDDLRLAARRLAQRPGFTAIAVLTLALGLGANIAIFTLVNATLLQRLPVARPDELVRLGDNDNCCVNRLMARLTGAYGLLAVVVAAVGLYGVTAYTVSRRTREIGVRMALGAEPRRVVAEVLRGALTQTGIGLLVGLPAAVMATGSLASLLFGVTARDPAVFAQAGLVLAASTLVAAVVPARRAASIDPARALRTD